MKFNAFHCFLVVAEQSSIGRAARVLNMRPGQLSRLMHDLEVLVGAPLLVRPSTSVVRLTRAGEMLQRLAPEHLAAEARLYKQVQEASAERGEALLRVTASDGVSAQDLRRITQLVSLRHPDLAITSTLTPLSRQVSGLLRGDFDVGLAQTETTSTTADLELTVEPAWHEPLMAIVPPGHGLYSSGPVSLPLLLSHRLIVADPTSCGGYGHQIGDWLKKECGASPDVEQASTMWYMCRTIARGRAVGLIGGLQWAQGQMPRMIARPVVDAETNEPCMLTTYLRRRSSVDSTMAHTLARFGEHLAAESWEIS